MKDGHTRLAYKAEHALDVDSELLVAAVVYRADEADTETLPVTVEVAQEQLAAVEAPKQGEELVADKGYYKADILETLKEEHKVRTYIAEPRYRGRRRWQDKPVEQQATVHANRRRVRGERGQRLGRWRSERVERSFAHMCETGGARRTWLRGVREVAKSYLGRAAAHNLAIIMLAVFGFGTARRLQGGIEVFFALLLGLWALQVTRWRSLAHPAPAQPLQVLPSPHLPSRPWVHLATTSSTGS